MAARLTGTLPQLENDLTIRRIREKWLKSQIHLWLLVLETKRPLGQKLLYQPPESWCSPASTASTGNLLHAPTPAPRQGLKACCVPIPLHVKGQDRNDLSRVQKSVGQCSFLLILPLLPKRPGRAMVDFSSQWEVEPWSLRANS